MNWPPLSAECSAAIADVLRDAVQARPKDLFEHVAQQLQDRSGKDPEAFAALFAECKRKPRTYSLEDRCPPSQDPLSWVPMRYNDDTILNMLRDRAANLIRDVQSQDAFEDSKALVDQAAVAFPELFYLRDSPEDLTAAQAVRAFYLALSGNPNILDQGLDDPDTNICFRCGALVAFAREQLAGSLNALGEDALQVLMVICAFRVLGRNEAFKNKFGGGVSSPEFAALYAMERTPEALPSFQRLDDKSKELIHACLHAFLPLAMIVSLEAVPAHFERIKELLSPREGGLKIFFAALLIDHLVSSRNTIFTDEAVDLVRLAAQCAGAVEKHSPARAYELLLKKRAERHGWRLVRDDCLLRAIVRLCCMAGVEDRSVWGSLHLAIEGLGAEEKAVLKTELGRKDGVADCPAYVLIGGAALLSYVARHGRDTTAAVRLLCRVLEDASQAFDRSLNHKVVKLNLKALLAKARESGSKPLDETYFALVDVGPGEVMAQVK